MIKFPNLGNQPEPTQKKMTPEEYLRFCDFCRKNNPHITAGNNPLCKAGKEDIKVPFRL